MFPVENRRLYQFWFRKEERTPTKPWTPTTSSLFHVYGYIANNSIHCIIVYSFLIGQVLVIMSEEVATTAGGGAAKKEDDVPDLNLSHITDGDSSRGIPMAKFIDNVEEFASSFEPPAQAELLIGAYSDLMNRYRLYESKLSQKRKLFGVDPARFFRRCRSLQQPISPIVFRVNIYAFFHSSPQPTNNKNQ